MRILVILSDDFSAEVLEKLFQIAWLKFKISDIFITFTKELEKHSKAFSLFAYKTFVQPNIDDRLIEFKFEDNLSLELLKFQSFSENGTRISTAIT